MAEVKYLTDEERKCSHFVFAVLDATIIQYGNAILDCGHETDGKCVCMDKDIQGRYWAMCEECFDKIPRTEEEQQIVNTERTVNPQYINKEAKC